jgi:hypothetical protein
VRFYRRIEPGYGSKWHTPSVGPRSQARIAPNGDIYGKGENDPLLIFGETNSTGTDRGSTLPLGHRVIAGQSQGKFLCSARFK